MANQWTTAQMAAITEQGNNLLIAAAAGSGKTAVLVERIIRKITDKTNPVDVDRLLVVTFTKAAAAEMRERVRLALEKALAEEPENGHLRRQIALLGRAKITTIDAFSLEVVRQNYTRLDLDPSFRVGDESELDLLAEDVLEDLFEASYAEENAGFLRLVETFGGQSTDRGLRDLVRKVYGFCQSHPFPMAWLHEAVAAYAIREGMPLERTLWGGYLYRETLRNLEDMEKANEMAVQLAEEKALDRHLETFTKDKAVLNTLQQALTEGFDSFFVQLWNVKLPAIVRKKAEDDEEAVAGVKALRERFKDALKDLKDTLYFRQPGDFLAQLMETHDLLLSLEALVVAFDGAFLQAKKERNLSDFNGVAHDCLRALLEEGSTVAHMIPTPAALELQERFEEVMTDEYQDSNLVQEMMLRAVSRGDNRFMVGDVKQSIYRFRLADSQLFMEKYRRYADGVAGKRIDLSQNFRSRKTVLDFTNFLFERLMDEELGDLPYDDAAALHAGAAYAPMPEAALQTEVLLVNQKGETGISELDDLNAAELEANVIADRILALRSPESKFQVSERDGTVHLPEFRDMVILLRSPGSWGRVLAETLERRGIPAFAETKGGYYDTTEVMTILDFLRILDNPRQDIPLLGVLHSPIYGFSSERLLTLRKQGQGEDFYTCLTQCAGEADVASFLSDLAMWRQRSTQTSVEVLLRSIYEETGYFDYLAATPGGAIRQANLDMLTEKAAQMAAAGVQSLFHFIRVLSRLQARDSRAEGAKTQAESANVVRIISIHKSKGLEYPVVFLSGLGRKFNKQDLNQPVLFHQDLGIGLDVWNLAERTQYTGLSRSILRRCLDRENLSEELRVLYVALTRAKEKLILTGSLRDLDKAVEKWKQPVPTVGVLPRQLRLDAANYLDWIMPVLDGETGSALWQVQFLNRENLSQAEDVEVQDTILGLDAWDTAPDYSGNRKEIFDRLSYRYPYTAAVTLPGSISVSEIKRIQQAEALPEGESLFAAQRLNPPKFVLEEEWLSAAARGTALHTVMEALDFGHPYSAGELAELVENLVRKGRLTREESKTIPQRKVLQFLESPIGKRLRQAEAIYKEQTFALALSPREIYGERWQGEDETILLHGMIDCYFREKGHLVLLDYKTDRLPEGGVEDLKKRYALQLTLYRLAIERMTGETVSESYLYLFQIDTAVKA